jgi:hypothetical protein
VIDGLRPTSLRQRIDDSDGESEYKQTSLSLLQTSASAYRRYRSSQCDFEASTAAGGNGAEDLRSNAKWR